MYGNPSDSGSGPEISCLADPTLSPLGFGSHRMPDAAAQVQKLLRQQAAIARFGSFALREWDLMKRLNETTRVCAEGHNVPFSKVCRSRAEQNDLLIVAGHGWQEGVIGYVVSRADASSPQGLGVTSGQPTICEDFAKH